MSCTVFGAHSSNFGAKIVLFFEVSKRKMSNLNKTHFFTFGVLWSFLGSYLAIWLERFFLLWFFLGI